MKYQIIEKIEDSMFLKFECSYQQEAKHFYETYENQTDSGVSMVKKKLELEINPILDLKRQQGYSKTKDCNFLTMIYISSFHGDGEFYGYSTGVTYWTDKESIRDLTYEKLEKESEDCPEASTSIEHMYHVLPDQSLLEMEVDSSTYKKDIKNMYPFIMDLRKKIILNMTLESDLTNKSKSNHKAKI